MKFEKNFSSLADVIGDCCPSALVALDRAFAETIDALSDMDEDAENMATILRFARARLDIIEAASSLCGVGDFVDDQLRAGVVPLLGFGVVPDPVDRVAPAAVSAADPSLTFRALLEGLPVQSVALIGLALHQSGLMSAGGVVDRAWANVEAFGIDQGKVDIVDYEFGGEDGISAALKRAVGM